MATDGPTGASGATGARRAMSIDPPGRGGRLQGFRLARRASRGDRAAFEQIFRRHHQELYRYCFALVHDRDDAEDAMQATMAAALRALPGEDRRIDIRPWLFRIAHNESISLLRRGRTEQLDEAGIPEREGASQEDRLAIRDRIRRLVVDLNDLPERQRAALVMRELSGLSYAEIGAALSCSEGGARQAVYEARTALRELEEGRDMECEEVRRTISERDGRRLRGRKLRAHLRGCDGCSGFAAAIPERQADLSSLCPPLPAAAAGTILTGLLGGGGGAATGAGAAGITGVAGGGMAASLAIKGGSIAAAIALAAGLADVGGLIHLPGPTGGAKESAAAPAAPAPTPTDGRAQRSSAGPAVTEPSGHARPTSRGGGGGHSGSSGSGGGDQGSLGSAGAPSNSASAPAPAPSQSAGPPAGSGNSSTAPGQTGAAPGGGSADAPGQTGILPGNAATAPGHSAVSPGNSATAPGQTAAAPPGQTSNPGNGNGSDSK